MRNVDDILADVYGSKPEAIKALKTTHSGLWNWRKWGYFPADIALQILKDAKKRRVLLDVGEVPVRKFERSGAAT